MMIDRKRIAAILLCAVAGLTVAAAAPPAQAQSGQDAQEQKEPEFSKGFRKKAGKVQEDIQAQDWPKALEGIASLEALDGLTEDDRRVILSWKLSALQATGDREAFMATIEEFLGSGLAAPDQIGPMNQQLAAWYNGKKDLDKTIEHYAKFVAVTPDVSPQECETMGRLYLQAGDNAAGVDWLGKAIDRATAAGEVPAEVWYQLRDRAYVDLEDQASRLSNLEELVKRYPKAEYYSRVLSLYSQATEDDRLLMLNGYRLEVLDTGLETVGQYLSYADHAMALGSPGEAARALKQGMDKGIVPSEGSNQQSLKDAEAAVATDRKSLPRDAETAAGNPKGEVDVKVGLGFYSLGDWDRTAELVRRGLKKGGVNHVDEANLLLGAALVQSGEYEQAKEAFSAAAAAAAEGSYMKRMAGLWKAFADRKSGGSGAG
jgi:tetratricopeptide (TPR) repeat protein